MAALWLWAMQIWRNLEEEVWGRCNDFRLKRKITNVSIMQVEAGRREGENREGEESQQGEA